MYVASTIAKNIPSTSIHFFAQCLFVSRTTPDKKSEYREQSKWKVQSGLSCVANLHFESKFPVCWTTFASPIDSIWIPRLVRATRSSEIHLVSKPPISHDIYFFIVTIHIRPTQDGAARVGISDRNIHTPHSRTNWISLLGFNNFISLSIIHVFILVPRFEAFLRPVQ